MTRLRQAFAEQSGHCAALGSPFMGQLMNLCAAHWPDDGALARKALDWPGDLGPKAASLPLRIAGGLHALVLGGGATGLAAVYPPHAPSDAALWDAVANALEHHATFLSDWIDLPPQTNEVRRAACLVPVAHMLAERFALPLRLSEIGASGGLNLNFDRFQLQLGARTFGPQGTVTLAPEWTGEAPVPHTPSIADRRGVDISPLDPSNPADALRLLAYVWPDQSDRLARTRAAIALPRAPVDRADGVDWLETRLPHVTGQAHMLYSTIAWQYLPQTRQTEGATRIAEAGASATRAHPLAWLRMEADSDREGAALRLQLWPGDHDILLARVDFHGRWIRWVGPNALP